MTDRPDTPADLRTQTVGAIVTRDYRTAAVFERHGIDFCCGGDVALGDACVAARVDLEQVQKDLAHATATAPAAHDDDVTSWTLTQLIDHIDAAHHTYVREDAPRIGALARKIEEERVFFPAVKRAEAATRAGEAVDPADADTLRTGVGQLAAEHDEVGGALHRIRDLAMGYALPPDACATYELTFRSLREFEADIHRHVHLENNVLLPGMAALIA